MYSLSDYGSMIADQVRMDPYALALKRAVGPHSVVLDIGAATGIHALLAAKFGARKIYAIEPNEAVHLARMLAAANGFDDRIEFIQDISTNITLPELADVVVSDLRGILPLFSHHIPSMIDARQRHLSPSGVLIPRQDTLFIALVESRHTYKNLVQAWDFPYGLNMEDARLIVLNSWSSDNTENITSNSLLTVPKIWTVLDYASIVNPNVDSSNIVCTATRNGTAHGILVWFDAELMDGIGFSNGPNKTRTAEVYGRGFFPLLEPVPIEAGDTIIIDLSAELVGSDYIWGWNTRIFAGDDQNTLKADFIQTTDFGQDSFSKQSRERIFGLRPALGTDGQIDHYILGEMDGRTSLDSIAQGTMAQYPDRFRSKDEALQYVYELFQQYVD